MPPSQAANHHPSRVSWLLPLPGMHAYSTKFASEEVKLLSLSCSFASTKSTSNICLQLLSALSRILNTYGSLLKIVIGTDEWNISKSGPKSGACIICICNGAHAEARFETRTANSGFSIVKHSETAFQCFGQVRQVVGSFLLKDFAFCVAEHQHAQCREFLAQVL